MDYDPKRNERRWGIIMTVLACITALMCLVSYSKQETGTIHEGGSDNQQLIQISISDEKK